MKRVALSFTGTDKRLFPFVEHVAWCVAGKSSVTGGRMRARPRSFSRPCRAMKQVPTMKVAGPMPMPRRTLRRGVLKSPFKHGSARVRREREGGLLPLLGSCLLCRNRGSCAATSAW